MQPFFSELRRQSAVSDNPFTKAIVNATVIGRQIALLILEIL